MTIPNFFTLARLLLMPIFVLFFYLPFTWSHVGCAIIFAIAAITDWVDGYLARTLQQVSAFGTFLDPLADKVIVAIALVLLVGEHAKALLAIPAAIIVSREIVISGLREWMAELGKRANVRVNVLGKIKTVAQMAAIFILLLYPPSAPQRWLMWTGYLLIYIAAGLTLWSMCVYLKAAAGELSLQKNTISS